MGGGILRPHGAQLVQVAARSNPSMKFVVLLLHKGTARIDFVLCQRAARSPEISDPKFFFGLNLFFEKSWENAKSPYKSPPQAEI